ncbi:MAG TPA: PQQ-binding-like beta-propeller repeat protein, partial [Urbifossiella sp.]
MRRKCIYAAMAALFVAAAGRADDWPQWLGPTRNSVWHETGILAKFPEGGPKILWRAPIDGGFAGPAVAGRKVFVTDYVTKNDARWKPDSGKRDRLEGQERTL